MKIEKYKKLSGNRYKLFLEDGEELILYEEVILKYELLLHQKIEIKMRIEISRLNQEYDVYYVALRLLKSRFRSRYELKEMLIRREYPVEMIEKALTKLESQGYLNDQSFAKSYVHNQMITTSKGPKKLYQELLDKKISTDFILIALEDYSESLQTERIEKIVSKMIKSNHTRGGNVLRKKIFQDLLRLGYNPSLIQDTLEKQDFSDNVDLSKKTYDKLYQRLSRKYSGKELEYKIREKMYQKGFYYEE